MNTLFGFISPEVMALAIPLLTITGGVVIAIVAILMEARKKELVHKERIIAIEKGIELPPFEQPEPSRASYISNRNTGLVMLFLGIAITIALWAVAGKDGGVWGLIPLAIGVGLLVASRLEKRETGTSMSSKSQEKMPMP